MKAEYSDFMTKKAGFFCLFVCLFVCFYTCSIYLVKNILHISLKLLKYENIKLQFLAFNNVTMQAWSKVVICHPLS